ncbi:MAG: FmdB family zinc ribbon protein [Actinomycetota bacterium]
MPEYDFVCGGCGEAVTIRATMKEKQEGPKCPLCGSDELAQVFSPIGVLGGCESSPSKVPG